MEEGIAAVLRYLRLCLGALLLTVGCKPATPSATGQSGPATGAAGESTAAGFGRFDGTVVASWDDGGRTMTLKEPFAYFDSRNHRWLAPAGSVVDGASIPAAFWTIIGGPFEGKYRNASVVHDVGCVEMRDSWEDVHRMFYEACRCGGVDDFQAKMLYYAVYHFGPRWELVTEEPAEGSADGDGQAPDKQVKMQRVARVDPPPPTPELR